MIASMKPAAIAAALTRLSVSLNVPLMVSPTSTSRIELVIGMPGISSMISPIMIRSAFRTGKILERMQELKEQRTSKQPLDKPSAGSTFKRPEGHFAGKLIMDAGLKGYSVGGACVSPKHAGFVVNNGGATAADVVAVIDHVKAEVESRFGVQLECEVRMIGEF